jgi:TRAP-type mannitol/chloroaromatic compound transport system permease small subunit
VNALIRAIERAVGAVGIFAALLLVPLTLATCWEVFSRYVMKAPTVWAYEIGYLLTGSYFLLGLAYTLREREHIRIDIFSGKFSPRTRAIIDLVVYCIVLPLLIWLTIALAQHFWIGWSRFERTGQSAMNMPVWPFRTVFVVSFLILALQTFVELLKTLVSMKEGAR